jgi:hypothetical protein
MLGLMEDIYQWAKHFPARIDETEEVFIMLFYR